MEVCVHTLTVGQARDEYLGEYAHPNRVPSVLTSQTLLRRRSSMTTEIFRQLCNIGLMGHSPVI